MGIDKDALHVGGENLSGYPGRITVEHDPGDTLGLGLYVLPSRASNNERATVKLGDWTLGQDVNANGSKSCSVGCEMWRSNIPLIIAPTGSMGNNGALTSGTVNPLIYLKTYTWFPTGAIFTASPAGWYWTVWTTTTAATVYQETWNGTSEPQAVASPTLWSKTGPGAFTGPTTEAAYFSVSLAALDVNARIRILKKFNATSNANAKTSLVRMTNVAGTTFHTDTLTSLAEVNSDKTIHVNGVADKQIVGGLAFGATAFVREAAALKAETTSAAFVLAFTVAKGTATDVVVIEAVSVVLQ
jgi:hypothetical protein